MKRKATMTPPESLIITGVDEWGRDTVFGEGHDGTVGFFLNDEASEYAPFEFGEVEEADEELAKHGFKRDGYSIKARWDY